MTRMRFRTDSLRLLSDEITEITHTGGHRMTPECILGGSWLLVDLDAGVAVSETLINMTARRVDIELAK